MYGLDLFSGIGGITKALKGYVEPVAYCENDKYAQATLLSRMAKGDIPFAPIWDDVTTLRGAMLPPIEIIYGGFPCQDISNAGRREGLEGKRSGLFFEIIRLISEIRPGFVFLENVSAIPYRGLGTITTEFAKLRYDCRWGILSAKDVGANHLRERWWLLAHARHGSGRNIGATEGGKDASQERSGDHHAAGGSGEQSDDVADASSRGAGPISKGQRQEGKGKSHLDRESQNVENPAILRCRQKGARKSITSSENVAHTTGKISARLQIGKKSKHSKPGKSGQMAESERKRWEKSWDLGISKIGKQADSAPNSGWWQSEPNVGRVAHGIPLRVDRLRGLGNAVVPEQAREAFERLMGLKQEGRDRE